MGYLDAGGLAHFWGTIKAALLGKQDTLTPDESIALEDGSIGVKTPVKPLTQAEYDALSEEQKQAEAVYLVDEPPWMPAPLSIQEYDTEDGWHVRKWSDGYVEAFYPFQFEVTTWKSYQGHAFSTITEQRKFPLAFTTVYEETASIRGTNSDCMIMALCDNSDSSNYTNRYVLLCFWPTPGTISGKAAITVVGRWK